MTYGRSPGKSRLGAAAQAAGAGPFTGRCRAASSLALRGVALLEVLVALAILSATGLSLAGLVGADVRAEQESRLREQALSAQGRALTALSLLGRQDLDRRLGRHRLGEFIVNVERPEATLYRIALADTIAPEVEALVTVVYRREPARAP